MWSQSDTQINRGKDFSVYFGTNGDNISTIYFQLMYSPDGHGWYPLGEITTSDSQTVQINDLPGGSNSKLILLASDGLKTVAFEGSTIDVPHKAPVLSWRHHAGIVRTSTTLPDPNDPKSQYSSTFGTVPYNGSVGSPIHLSVGVQNEWGRIISNPIAEWTIYDNNNQVVRTIKDQVDFINFKLGKPGNYLVKVTMTDPNTGVSSTISVDLKVEKAIIAASEVEYQSFLKAIENVHANYGVSSTSSSTTPPQVTESDNGNPLSLPLDPISIILGIGFAVMVINTRHSNQIKLSKY